MSSIGSTLNTINTALLGEVGSYRSTSKSTGNGSTVQSNSTAPTDRFDRSKAADVFRALQQLQTDNPTEFKQVLTDAASKLKDAASQETDPGQAKFLSNLSDRFQKAADTGDLSQLQQQPQSADGSYSAQGQPHHHHHRGGGEPPPPPPTDSSQSLVSSILNSTKTSQTSSQLQDLLPSLFGGSS